MNNFKKGDRVVYTGAQAGPGASGVGAKGIVVRSTNPGDSYEGFWRKFKAKEVR